MEVKGMATCPVCHRDFAIIIEDHYVAQDVGEVGLITAIKGHEEPKRYDAIDCPHCGCQTILQERKPEYCPCDYGICDECTDCTECVREDEDNA